MICEICSSLGFQKLYRCMDCYVDGSDTCDMCESCLEEHQVNNEFECNIKPLVKCYICDKLFYTEKGKLRHLTKKHNLIQMVIK